MAGLFSCCIGFSGKNKQQEENLEQPHSGRPDCDTTNTKMVFSSVQDALEQLHSIFGHARDISLRMLVIQVEDFQLQFRFLQMFLWFFPQWDCDDQNLLSRFSHIATQIESVRENISNGHSIGRIVTGLKDPTQECKAEIKKYIEHLISCSLKSQPPFTRNETIKFLDFINVSMNGLVDESSPAKSQVTALKEKLFLLRHLIHFTVPMSGGEENYDRKEALDFGFYAYDWATNSARLIILYWLNEEQDEETGDKIKGLHQDLLLKTPEFTRLCFVFIKVPKVIRSDTIIFGEFLSSFLDFFLENIVFSLNDDVPMLREGLILLIAFLADPPEYARDHHLSFFQNKIHAVLDQASHTISLFDETSMDLARRKTNVVHLQKSIDKVRGEIERFYVQIPHPLWSNFPRTNGLGHFESLLVYLENLTEAMNKNKMLVPFLKHRIFAIKEELTLLRPHLQEIWKMQNEHDQVKDLREQITSLSYQSDFAIKSSFFIDHPIWYNLTCLSFVVEKIKDIQSNVMRIKDICTVEVVLPLLSSAVVFYTPTSTSIVEVVVGFKHETEVLIERLTRGTAKLDIVSIVGMGGIGKTTLSKKLFNEPSISYYFHKRAFCTVSQEYLKRNVLLDILNDICTIDDEVRRKSDGDLAHLLKNCLSGCKYLIVMDDMWNVDDWFDVRASFPDNNNGSRVIFTTRISNISLIAKPDSSPCLLPFLSVDESWELLKQNIFHKDPCPLHLCKVGKLIAEKCRGLPLAIVVIAGILTRTEMHLSKWNEVAETLTTFASSEGCKDAIRLSYKRLSEPLKSCFLYLGAFREDEKIKSKMLINLWVAEGFVLKSGNSCSLSKVAQQYLNELGDRNLVTVTSRSCNGGIKHFYVHDLVRDFCRSEAQEQHYWYFVSSHNSKVSMPGVCDQYRVCSEDGWISVTDYKAKCPTVHSLLHYSKYVHGDKYLESFLYNFKLVQVLDLRMLLFEEEGFPAAVTTLVHLRYLALRFWTSCVNVPSEINNLWNLETLLLFHAWRYQKKFEFPCDIWKMKKLRHVETDGEARVALDDDVSGVLSQLPDLETFTFLVIPTAEAGVELLRRLPNVRKLSCQIDGSYQMPKLDILTNLESLQMSNIGFSPYPYTFNSFPLTIKKLTISTFKLCWNEFTAVIRKLPKLQVLMLRGTESSKGAKIWDVQDEEFPNIMSLTLYALDIKQWKASIDSFPCIENLILSYCRHLIEVPPCFGEAPALKSILVRRCNKGVEVSSLQIQKDQLDSGNEINLQVETK